MTNTDRIVDTVPMKFTLTATYEAPVWSDDSDDLDVIAREEKAELQSTVEEFLMRLDDHPKNVQFTIEPVFETTKE